MTKCIDPTDKICNMTHGSLFSGIGGFDLASERMGWENVFHCEWNEFGQKILKYYWPKAISYEDITKTDFSIHRGNIDILTGGFPCQPYSTAGKRLGKADDRHLWPSMLRAIREIKPKYVVGENVSGLLSWDGGLVFEEVQADLETEGYEVQPVLLPACAVNAPHRRDRIWFVAHSNSCGSMELNKSKKGWKWSSKRKALSNTLPSDGLWATSDTTSSRRYEDNRGRKSGLINKKSADSNWENFPTQSPICGGDDGFSDRLDRITFSKWRNESIKGYGNAIVPQVALQIFKAIVETENKII